VAVKLGIFVVPDATDPAATVEQLVAADAAGLDLVGVQDHPYQRRFFDTWDAIEAMGGPRRTPKEAVDALAEAIAILRAFWSGEPSVDFEGAHYRV
jgi:alkanesulfonate monooxygenase SsuD/methylene tetrahydromethanopterin reductase-like flavin-dependent oxidoreductase (luciferase family)